MALLRGDAVAGRALLFLATGERADDADVRSELCTAVNWVTDLAEVLGRELVL